jgi:hypothetical protein
MAFEFRMELGPHWVEHRLVFGLGRTGFDGVASGLCIAGV